MNEQSDEMINYSVGRERNDERLFYRRAVSRKRAETHSRFIIHKVCFFREVVKNIIISLIW